MPSRYRGIDELFRNDPERADRLFRGREGDPVSRRGFLKGSGLAAMSAVIGRAIPYARWAPAGLVPVALAGTPAETVTGRKDGLVILNDRPLNAETPAHLLDDSITPANRLFVRNNGIPPAVSSVDPASWTLTIGGESAARERTYSIADLKRQFEHHTYQLQLECGGNGRSEYVPAAPGNQWTTGAIGCPQWTGVRLADVLADTGIHQDAVYIGYYGADLHASGDPGKVPISRGVPMFKALEKETLVAWSMNGDDIPLQHGAPLRLVIGGWPGSVSGKWLERIVVRNRIHDGPKMTGYSYRVPCSPVPPGAAVPEDQMCIIQSMPVKSLITRPRSGIEHDAGEMLPVRGHAWAGDSVVSSMSVSIDFGATWQPAKVAPPANRLAWQRWTAAVRFPRPGYYEVWARATDDTGRSQPMLVPGWNPKGYLNNACHRIAVLVV